MAARITFIGEPSAAVLVHELSHVLPIRSRDSIAVWRREVTSADEVSMAMTFGLTRDAVIESEQHDAAFVRRGLHLAHRAERCGVKVNLASCQLSGRQYRSPEIAELSRLLGDEPTRYLGLTFAEIERRPAPIEFRSHFQFVREAYEVREL